LLGAQVGLLSAVLISINNFRDREGDALVGKRTLAVKFGSKLGAGIIWLEIKLAAFLGLGWLAMGHPVFCVASIPVFIIGMRIIWGVLTIPPGKGFNKLLAMAAIQLLLFAGAFQAVASFFVSESN
jgi:1,4-dihydroxy-2-naphthoate octaprenyltransferase